MKTNTKPECYGHLFPDFLNFHADSMAGHAFTCRIETTHGFLAPRKTVEVNQEAWDVCCKCDRFDGCYKQSIAKLELEKVLLAMN